MTLDGYQTAEKIPKKDLIGTNGETRIWTMGFELHDSVKFLIFIKRLGLCKKDFVLRKDTLGI